jgi:hypothetical protein
MGLLLFKFTFIIAFLFFFLNPKTTQNKFEIALFLMNYFAFLGCDVTWKVKTFERN